MHSPSRCIPRRADLPALLIRVDLFRGVDVSLLPTAKTSTRESGCCNLRRLHLRLSGIAHHDLESDLVSADLLHLGKELHLLFAGIPRLADTCAHHGDIDR